VDTLEEVWKGRKPENLAPEIGPISGMPAAALAPGQKWQPRVESKDPDSDPLHWQWAVLPELQGHQHNGRKMHEIRKALETFRFQGKACVQESERFRKKVSDPVSILRGHQEKQHFYQPRRQRLVKLAFCLIE
jgi:hypothetical protein